MISKKKIFSISVVLVILVSVMILSVTLKADAKENQDNKEKYYTSIIIEEGDTLWSIAEEYKPDENMTVSKYIKDLKRMNNMDTDTIHAGNYLTIYYYNN